MTRTCGTCALCCKLPEVLELEKPAGVWCRHCTPGKMHPCTIYRDPAKPKRCDDFVCLWLDAQSPERQRVLPDSLRPDRCHVFIALQPDNRAALHVDPQRPNAWRQQPFVGFLHRFLMAGGTAVVLIRGQLEFVLALGSRGEIKAVPKSKLDIAIDHANPQLLHVKEKTHAPSGPPIS